MKINNHYVYSLSEVRTFIEDSNHFEAYFKSESEKFCTKLNPTLSLFLKEKSLKLNDQNLLRTYLIINTDTLEFIGYFCLKVVNIKLDDNVSNKIKKKISSDAKKNNEFPAILITKLARNDRYKNEFPGKLIMDYALSIGNRIYKSIALRHICVDWYQNEKLKHFYCEECGFKVFQSKVIKNHNDEKESKILVSAFYKYQ
ncbi:MULTISPECIES: hypothetical protein [unclassified Staphylococcus]|uniref:hypothetical protein n=1 Tax=unclassified Staphylococcus TaxID=91994 RepID=UPI0021CFBBA9|nr:MULTISPECIES: hypothetical protein [unclassified Staphylococcus]UXR70144.1 hypothetical protein MUA26_03145 [Staphylococcus sp. IVB6246]UXR72203.1 hypothetical protein MUA88_03225 [Staphylococcus sp. IVB6240]UXR74512.1 hypothetical protein MUA48_03400 [Staphylococcus sp. IVB6238]UXR76896.1 hypothetical protein MUA74_03765 [Staphylococcus sp. IVB6233]UXR81022.1 hypothetical protein MUA65_03370 [Staphylococcus sp. IVB6218]